MPISFEPKIDYSQFKDSTLILPIVSAGNVAQLASDLLIASLGLKRVAILNPEWVIPVAGAREDGERGVTTPLEVFGKMEGGGKVFVLQQRSPAFSAHKVEFTQQLVDFVQKAGFSVVLLTSGMDVVARTDRHMGSPLYHYLATQPNKPFADRLTLTTPAFLSSSSSSSDPPAKSELPPIPGSGLLRRILRALKEQLPNAELGVLMQYVMEGDNRADAAVLAQAAAKVADVAVSEWREPQSWRVGLFGTPQEQTLYG